MEIKDIRSFKDEFQEATTQKSAADLENSIRAILESELTELQRRVEDLETKDTKAFPIPHLTPIDDLGKTKKTINFLINYLNIGINRNRSSL